MKKKAVIFGVGYNYKVHEAFLFETYEIAGIIDNNSAMQGTIINALIVSPPEKIKTIQYDAIIITVGEPAKKAIILQLTEIGCIPEKIIGVMDIKAQSNIVRYRSIFGTYTRFQGEKLISSICRPTDLETISEWECQLSGIEQCGLPINTKSKTYIKNRKTWEFVYICQALKERGMLKAGMKGLCFAAGKEPLSSVFASLGCKITATDATPGIADIWKKTNQQSDDIENLYHPHIIDKEKFLQNVSFKYADMNNIPQDEKDYDFLWSSCALEHLGSIHAAKDFIYRAMNCLKPGGIAVHTTELNLDSSFDTFISNEISLIRSIDLIEVAEHLQLMGHCIEPLDFRLDGSPADDDVSFPPYSEPHFKLCYQNYTITSFGLIIHKGVKL
jgi:2-polyprenyl-3-methyl-5-hydroxy-6-metoxy-1,4-benzoquinol methylase